MGLLTSTARESLKAGPIQIGTLVELDFSFGVERYWSGVHNLDFEGEEYLAVGDAGTISPLESSSELRANGLSLGLTIPHEAGSPVSRFQNVTAANYKNRSARVILAFFDPTFNTAIHSMERVYSMDVLSYSVDPSTATTISVNVESELMRGGKRSIKRLTDEQQRNDFPSDISLQFLSYLASGVEVSWGVGGAFFRN